MELDALNISAAFLVVVRLAIEMGGGLFACAVAFDIISDAQRGYSDLP